MDTTVVSDSETESPPSGSRVFQMENASKKIPRFFKVYMPEYSSQRMLVPRGFLAWLERPLSGEILLRCRMGRQWPVKVILEAQNVYFEEGWREFVRDNFIETHDFVVFSYQSHRALSVALFGRSGCEKREFALPEEVEKGGEVWEHDGKHEEEEEEEEEHQGKRRRSKKEEDVGESKAANEDRVDVKRYIDPKNPYFVTVIRTNRRGLLFFPGTVLKDYELKLPSAVEFQDPNGRTWRGTVRVWKDRRNWISGWGVVCRRNNLKENDRCVCEILEEGVTRLIIKVHIVRGDGT